MSNDFTSDKSDAKPSAFATCDDEETLWDSSEKIYHGHEISELSLTLYGNEIEPLGDVQSASINDRGILRDEKIGPVHRKAKLSSEIIDGDHSKEFSSSFLTSGNATSDEPFQGNIEEHRQACPTFAEPNNLKLDQDAPAFEQHQYAVLRNVPPLRPSLKAAPSNNGQQPTVETVTSSQVVRVATSPQTSKAALEKLPAVFLWWLGHAGTKEYHKVIKEIFADCVAANTNNPKCPRNIEQQVRNRLRNRLQERGIYHVFVCVGANHKPLTERILNQSKSGFLGTWCEASEPIVSSRVRSCFKDIRKLYMRNRKQQHASSRVPEPHHSGATIPQSPLHSFTENCVCFHWSHWPATIKCSAVVESFAFNTEAYPEWVDSIAGKVREKLAKENIYAFYVFLNTETGEPCLSIGDGMLYEANDATVVDHIKTEFLADRQSWLSMLSDMSATS